MKNRITLTFSIIAALFLTACGGMGTKADINMQRPASINIASTAMGDVYTDASGMTLYTFGKDTANKSNCYDGCAAKWPPLFATDSDMTIGEFSVISRDDGTKQWALAGQALYLWVKDTMKGDTTGHNVGNVWFAATVDK